MTDRPPRWPPWAGRGPRGVLVLGMHRSGTSAATRLLNELGPALCAPGDMVRGPWNPSGHCESRSLMHLNDALAGADGSDVVVPAPRWRCLRRGGGVRHHQTRTSSTGVSARPPQRPLGVEGPPHLGAGPVLAQDTRTTSGGGDRVPQPPRRGGVAATPSWGAGVVRGRAVGALQPSPPGPCRWPARPRHPLRRPRGRLDGLVGQGPRLPGRHGDGPARHSRYRTSGWFRRPSSAPQLAFPGPGAAAGPRRRGPVRRPRGQPGVQRRVRRLPCWVPSPAPSKPSWPRWDRARSWTGTHRPGRRRTGGHHRRRTAGVRDHRDERYFLWPDHCAASWCPHR